MYSQAVPLFLFMGYLVERAGIVAKLFFAIRLAAHRLPASMAGGCFNNMYIIFNSDRNYRGGSYLNGSASLASNG
jgi:hypothetical protein